jgi:hypothetical protein
VPIARYRQCGRLSSRCSCAWLRCLIAFLCLLSRACAHTKLRLHRASSCCCTEPCSSNKRQRARWGQQNVTQHDAAGCNPIQSHGLSCSSFFFQNSGSDHDWLATHNSRVNPGTRQSLTPARDATQPYLTTPHNHAAACTADQRMWL